MRIVNIEPHTSSVNSRDSLFLVLFTEEAKQVICQQNGFFPITDNDGYSLTSIYNLLNIQQKCTNHAISDIIKHVAIE